MKPQFTINQRVEIFGLPDFDPDSVHNGQIVTVVALPGYHISLVDAYAVEFSDGTILPAVPKFLRPFPPKLPRGRGDLDKPSGWEQFQKATGIDPDVVKNGRPGNDY